MGTGPITAPAARDDAVAEAVRLLHRLASGPGGACWSPSVAAATAQVLEAIARDPVAGESSRAAGRRLANRVCLDLDPATGPATRS